MGCPYIINYMERRPDNTQDTYSGRLVEGFGKEMLARMGADPEVLRQEKAFVPLPRNHRMGLGADSVQEKKTEVLVVGESVVVVGGRHHG